MEGLTLSEDWIGVGWGDARGSGRVGGRKNYNWYVKIRLFSKIKIEEKKNHRKQ